MNKEELKRFNRELEMYQEFCPYCGGLRVLKVKGLLVNPENWYKYGLAHDIGCCC